MKRALSCALATALTAACKRSDAPVEPTPAPAVAQVPTPPVADSPSGDAATPAAPARLANGMLPLPEGPIAVVGGVEIPAAAFQEIYALKVGKYAERGREIPASADRRYRKSISERLIYAEVLRQEAAAAKLQDDSAELAKRESASKAGIADWAEHLRRRGESEHSLREMYVAELRERAILEARGTLTVSADEIDGRYKSLPAGERSRKKASEVKKEIAAQLEKDQLSAGRRALKGELLAKYAIVDHIAPTLGSDPRTEIVHDPSEDPPPIDPTAPPPKIGIAECDVFIAEYHRCILEKVPAAARPVMLQALHESAAVWAETAKTMKHSEFAEACAAARAAAREATQRFGCAFG